MGRSPEAAIGAAKIKAGQGRSIRVSPNSYLAALFLAAFISAFLLFMGYDAAAIGLFAVVWAVVPVLGFSDRIVLDGEMIYRSGIIPGLWAKLNGEASALAVADIEQVETQALRALKRGGSVFYRYRTSVRGKGLVFSFASGGEKYRNMARRLFSRLPEDVLDNRSIELRDYLEDPKDALMKAEFARVPSADVLEASINEFQAECKLRKPKRNNFSITEDDIEKANYLRKLANELRISGYLLQALETFRRALLLNPKDAWMLYEYSRCLHSFAGLEKNERLGKRANAALRLAEYRARNNQELLARIGESYFQYGDWLRAKSAFQKVLDSAGESFRSARGLAEIALREGKIAHVIHHFSAANRFAESPALKEWTKGEGEYFNKLNSDEIYMEAEIRRINWLESMQRHSGYALRFSIFGFLLILTGIFTEEAISSFGWAISAVSIFIWAVLLIGKNAFSRRIPLDIFPEDDGDGIY